MSKSRKDTSVCWNVHISISASWLSASWTVGELDCRRVDLSATWLSASWLSAHWTAGKLDCRRVGSVGELVVGELSSYPLQLPATPQPNLISPPPPRGSIQCLHVYNICLMYVYVIYVCFYVLRLYSTFAFFTHYKYCQHLKSVTIWCYYACLCLSSYYHITNECINTWYHTGPVGSGVTGQLADKPTRWQPSRRQAKLADKPTRRNWYGRFCTQTCLFSSWTLRPHAGRFRQSLKPHSDWQVSGARKNTILSTHSRSASSTHNVANQKCYLFKGL